MNGKTAKMNFSPKREKLAAARSAKLNIFAPLVDGPSQSVYLMKSEVFTILNELMHTREEGKVEMRRIWGGEGWLVGCTHCNFV